MIRYRRIFFVFLEQVLSPLLWTIMQDPIAQLLLGNTSLRGHLYASSYNMSQ